MAEIRSSRLSVAGISSPLAETGPADAREAVVCIHGVPGSGRDFQWLLPATGELLRSIALDLPGFGRADKPPTLPGGAPYSIEAYQLWLAPALEQLGVQRAHLILHAFGGIVGLMWAAMHPQRVASITLIDSGVLPGYRGNLLANMWRTPRLGELIQRATTRTLFKLWMRRGNLAGLDDRWLNELIDEDEQESRRVTLELYRNIEDLGSTLLGDALRPHDIDALVLWGKRDPYISWRYAERQREAFPRAQTHIWPDSGHWPHIQHPQRAAETISEFLRGQLASAQGGASAE